RSGPVDRRRGGAVGGGPARRPRGGPGPRRGGRSGRVAGGALMLAEPEFWVAVAFVIFVALVFKRARQIVNGALDRGAEAIRAQIEEARHLREEAQNRLYEYRRRQRDAIKEAEEIVARARQDAERQQARARADLEALLARRREQAL